MSQHACAALQASSSHHDAHVVFIPRRADKSVPGLSLSLIKELPSHQFRYPSLAQTHLVKQADHVVKPETCHVILVKSVADAGTHVPSTETHVDKATCQGVTMSLTHDPQVHEADSIQIATPQQQQAGEPHQASNVGNSTQSRPADTQTSAASHAAIVSPTITFHMDTHRHQAPMSHAALRTSADVPDAESTHQAQSSDVVAAPSTGMDGATGADGRSCSHSQVYDLSMTDGDGQR